MIFRSHPFLYSCREFVYVLKLGFMPDETRLKLIGHCIDHKIFKTKLTVILIDYPIYLIVFYGRLFGAVIMKNRFLI